MVFNNREGVKKLRRILLLIMAGLFLGMTVLVILGFFGSMAILAAILFLMILKVIFLNFQFVSIIEDGRKLIVRYYSILAFERSFETFEFPVAQLRNVTVTKHFLGLKWDITFTVRVQKGLADYPPVSLSAIPFSERTKLVMELRKLILEK